MIIDNNEFVAFESLDYGAYELVYEDNSFTENTHYGTAEFNKLHTRKVRLPTGKGNVVYLLSDTFENTLNMINSKNFIIPQSYKKIYFPWWSSCRFLGRKCVTSLDNSTKKSHNKKITEMTRLRPYTARNLNSSIDNVFFSTADMYQSFAEIMTKTSIKRNYDQFYISFVNSLSGLTPDKNDEHKGDPEWNNRLIIIDCDKFRFDASAPLNDNKTNPLYLFYLAYLRTRDLSKWNLDIDMLICSRNLFIKVNPAKMDMNSLPTFRRAIFRVMNTNFDDYIDHLSDSEKKEVDITSTDHTVAAVVDKVISPYTQLSSPSTKVVLANAVEKKLRDKADKALQMDHEIKAAQQSVAKQLGTEPPKRVSDPRPSIMKTNPVVTPLNQKALDLFKSVNQYQPLGVRTGELVIDDDEDFETPDDLEDIEDQLADDAAEVLTDDEEIKQEVLEDIQDKVAPLKNPKTAPINSARDQKLREEQKKIVVKDSTIDQVLAREASNVPVQTTDKSKVMHTTNQNMKNIKFANFDKTYLDELYMKDLVACFDMLKDKNSPFYITNIEIRDTSDSENLQETWTVKLVDESNKRHTIKVDIPKFFNDRFMLLNGNKYIILVQNFYNPLVKDTPDTVIFTTNYNKITIRRKATKSLTTIERIFSLIKKTGDTKIFTTGDSTRGNLKYISTLEYDELSRRLFKFSCNGCDIYFSRDYIKENLSNKIPKDIKGNEFYIGHEVSTPILINEDTGLDRQGRTIAEIIESNLPNDYQALYNSIKPPKQTMFVEGKLAGEWIPVITTMIVWEGITSTLNKMKIYWKFDNKTRRVPANTPSRKYIRFADGVLEYESKTYSELILAGLAKMQPEKFNFDDFNNETGYSDFIYSQWGSYNGIVQLKNFYEFLIDPITKDVCRDLMLPQDPTGLLIHAVKLLSDNAYVSKANDTSYRIRTIEMIPAILYGCIADQYRAYVNSGRRIPMTLNQRCVISKLMAEKTVEAYSTLNPVIEVTKTHTVSTKGYKGSNSVHSYDEEKRSYDPTAVGKLAISSSPDAQVGVNRNLVVEPTISNARGYRDQVEDVNQLKDVNIFSPAEMLTPGTARNDDPIRTAIAGKQSGHVVPVADAAPALVSNGYDEAVQFHLSDDFVINAEEDGKVIDVNEELGFVVVQYTSGKTKAISTRPTVVKNSGGGFFMSNNLTPTHTKVGEKFKKDEPLAYHDKFFRYSKTNGLRYSIGPIAKIAFMSSYNTYEDAGICTEEFAERMKSSIVYKEDRGFRKNNNIISMVKIGQHVGIGDTLIKYDTSVEENELARYLTKLSEENAALLAEETKNEVKSNHAGKVIDIKVYSLLDPNNLSPSLGAIVKQYFQTGVDKKKYLEKFDSSEGIVKAGYMLTDSTEPIKNRYNQIKGNKGIDVLIEIYIEHNDVMGVGDKIAVYGPNKQIISEVIPKGYEPYSEFRPDEEISIMTSPGTIARRMTPSILGISSAMKCLIELKRKIQSEIKYE